MSFVSCFKHCIIVLMTNDAIDFGIDVHNPGDKSKSLFGILNQTQTAGGARFLRSTLLQPPLDIATIQQRNIIVRELINNPFVLNDLVTNLRNVSDLEQLISSLMKIATANSKQFNKNKLTYLLHLKQTLESLPNFVNILRQIDNPVFESLSEAFEDVRIKTLYDHMMSVISENASVSKNSQQMITQVRNLFHRCLNPFDSIASV